MACLVSHNLPPQDKLHLKYTWIVHKLGAHQRKTKLTGYWLLVTGYFCLGVRVSFHATKDGILGFISLVTLSFLGVVFSWFTSVN